MCSFTYVWFLIVGLGVAAFAACILKGKSLLSQLRTHQKKKNLNHEYSTKDTILSYAQENGNMCCLSRIWHCQVNCKSSFKASFKALNLLASGLSFGIYRP
jgi:hypothetical protein